MPLPAGADAPRFTLPDGDGTPWSLADHTSAGGTAADHTRAGNAVLLAFFKTSCPTCRLAFPVYGELARRYGDVVPVVAVSQTAMATARPWLEEMGFAGPVVDDETARFSVSAAYQVRSVPTLVLVVEGRVAATSEAWDRDRVNEWARALGQRTGRDTKPVSTEDDGRPAFKPG